MNWYHITVLHVCNYASMPQKTDAGLVSSVLDSFTVPLHSPNGRHLPAVRVVQRDCHWGLKNGGALGNPNLYFDQPITKARCQPIRGNVSYPTDSWLGLCSSLSTFVKEATVIINMEYTVKGQREMWNAMFITNIPCFLTGACRNKLLEFCKIDIVPVKS